MKRLICMILAMLMIVSMVCVVSGQDDEEELPRYEDEEEPDVEYVEYPSGSGKFIPEDEVPKPESLIGG